MYQYRDLKFLDKEYVDEELPYFSICYTDMKNNYPIQVIDLRFQIDHISPKETQLLEEFNTDLLFVNARLFVILFRHKQIEIISDGNKLIEVKII